MQKLLIALTAGSALALSAPAAAQFGTQANANAGVGANIQNRIAQLDARLRAGVQTGAINRTEAQTLRRQLRDLTRLERQYSRNGLSRQERQDLRQRLRSLRQQFQMADGGGNGRWAENDRWDDDGWNNGPYQGQGGAYEEVRECDRNGGGIIGGVIGSIFGGGNDNCVEAGDRAPGNLSALPYELRGQFRDGNGIVYRTDGQRIYQIDVRTNTVLRVYAGER